MPKIAHTFTPKEKKKLRKLGWREFRLAVAGGDTEEPAAQLERIKDRGYDRARPEVASMQRRVDAAAAAVVEAKTDKRLARDREARTAAQNKLRDAERRLREVERAARKLGE